MEIADKLPNDNENKRLQYFVRETKKLVEKEDLSLEVKDLLLDIAVCTRDLKMILMLSKTLDYPEHYLYRAYAYSRLQDTNKIVSLKLNFQQKFTKALNVPRNKFIITSLEFLLLYGEQNFTMALTSAGDLEHIYDETENIGGTLYSQLMFTLIAQAYLKHNQYEKVNNLASRILQTAVTQKDPYFQSASLNLKTTVLINKGEFRKAQRMLNSAILPTEMTGLKADRATLLNNAAKLEMARGNYQKSVKLLENIAKLIEENVRGLAITLINIAELKILLGEKAEARTNVTQAIELEKKHNLNLVEPYLMAALLEIEEHKFMEAREYLDACHELLAETGENRLQPLLYYYEGLLAKREDNYEEATEWFEKAIGIARKMLNIEILIKSNFQLASVYFEKFKENRELQEFTNILKYLNNLVILAKEQFIPKLQCDIHVLKGLILAETGKRERAVKELLQAITLGQKFKYIQIVQDANNILRTIEKMHTTELEEKAALADVGFKDVEKIHEVLEKYEGFKFVKAPKRAENKIYGLAIVDKTTGTIQYRYSTMHEEADEASLVPTIVAAVNMFSKQLFEAEIELTHVKEQNKEIMIDDIGKHLVVLIADKLSFDISAHFERFVDRLEEKVLNTIQENSDKSTKILDQIFEEIFEPILRKKTQEEIEQKTITEAIDKKLEE